MVQNNLTARSLHSLKTQRSPSFAWTGWRPGRTGRLRFRQRCPL